MTTETDSPVRVLLVDDDPADAGVVRRHLKRGSRRYAAEFAQNMAEALDALSRRVFDVVVLDMHLPDSSGLETIERVHWRHPDVPIVVLTNMDDDELALAALDYGAQDHLVKGTTTTELLERAIRHSIQRQSHHAEIERLLSYIEVSNKLLEKKNRRLKKLYRTARRFVSKVSHEFRTPLTVVKEYVSLINDGLVGTVNPEQERLLNVVADRADDLNHMVDDMLDVSRLDAGLMQATRAPCPLADIIDHIRPSLERKASLKQVVLEVDVPANLPEVFCDPEKVARVLTNFIVNGINFASDPGRVSVSAEAHPEAQEVVVSVADNGSGIDPVDAEIVFERFRQLTRRRRRSTQGFGLGLSIARELIELNFGRAWVDSTLGRSSTFRFSLPLAFPREVVRRYLAHQGKDSDEVRPVALLGVALPEDATDASARDAGVYLNCLLRTNDLLFRSGSRRWTLVLDCSEPELPRFLQRAEKLRRVLNRNRQNGPLPEVVFTMHGVWDAVALEDEILTAVDQLTAEELYVRA